MPAQTAQPGHRIGCWLLDGATLRRSLPSGESLHFWADRPQIELRPGRETIVLVGESTARGYFYDPAFTPAEGLERLLGTSLPGTGPQVLDLARTNASMQDLLAVLRAAAVLRPRAVVIWAGNNWAPLEDVTPAEAPGVVAAVRKGAGALELRAHLDALHRRRVRGFIEEAAAVVRSMGADAVVVVPEFNLLGWHDALGEAPPVARARRARWAHVRRELLAAQAAGEAGRVEALADELLTLDGGLGSLGFHAKGMLRVRDDPPRARALLEEARDAELWPKSPRCHRATGAELREHGARHGLTVVDLPRRFAEHCGSPLPSRGLFLDYCHHSQEGLRVACASIAEALLRRSFGRRAAWRDLAARPLGIPGAVEARARFLAAAHSSAYGQPVDTLQGRLDEALGAHPGAQAVARQYARHRTGHAPHALAAGHLWDAQAERYFGPGGLRCGPLDVRLVGVILRRSREDIAEAVARHALGPRAVDMLCPAYGQLVTMDERTLEACGYHRSRRAASSFLVVLAEAAPVALDLTYRTPDAEASAAVHLACGARDVARLPASAAWTRARVSVPVSALEPGLNVLRVTWPGSALDGGEILARYADALALGESPVAPYPVLGEIFRLQASR